MTFKIILTVFCAVSALLNLANVDEPRKPTTVGTALVILVANAVIIYGLWNWL